MRLLGVEKGYDTSAASTDETRRRVLQAIVDLLQACERAGQWPAAVALVIIVLLPKPEAGLRPIGLLPLLPRIWMRARREQAQRWERRCGRTYIYGGGGQGGGGGGVEAGGSC